MAVSLDIADLRARKDRPASTLAPAALPTEAVNLAATETDGLGCHSGKDAMRAAAEAAGLSETLEQL